MQFYVRGGEVLCKWHWECRKEIQSHAETCQRVQHTFPYSFPEQGIVQNTV